MPRAFTITRQDDPQLVWDAYKKTLCSTERRRLQVIALLLEGKSRKEVESVTRYHRGSIVEIIHRYNESGITSLRNLQKENKGRKRKLSPEQCAEIAKDIDRGIDTGDYWTGEKLISHIKKKYGVEISLTTVYRLFDELGYSVQTPRPSHRKGDKDLQEDFKGKS